MKKAVLLNIVILICVAFAGYALNVYFNQRTPEIIVQPDAPAEEIADGNVAPDFTFTAMDGQEYALQQFRGKIVLLNFWASWCPPCVKEFPYFVEIANNHPDDVVFIGLSSDIAKKTMLAFVQKLKEQPDIKLDAPNIIIAHDKDEATHRIFNTYKLPETLIIDSNGYVREKLLGADWTVDYLEKRIEALGSEQ